MSRQRYLIIGNGAAGVAAAEEIRRRDPHGKITILGDEPYPMYSRPGLAYLLLDEVSERQLLARRPEWYTQHRIKLVHRRAAGLDIPARRVLLDGGRSLEFDQLLIATGARATPPPYPNAHLDGIFYLDTLAGAKDLLHGAHSAQRAVVIGGGITALEMAEGLAHLGVETHYFVRRNRLWGRVLSDLEATLIEQRMVARGITIHYNTEIADLSGDGEGHIRAVTLKQGGEFACDLLGVAIGVKPHLDLVRNTPIQIERGILVDEYLQTNVPGIYAAGDCAQVYDRWTQSHQLDSLWPSAVAAGRVAGLNMSGEPQPFVKGIPFNVCLLFGLHITLIGQVAPQRGAGDNGALEVVEHLTRGSSEVWASLPRAHYTSAWVQDGHNSLRLMVGANRLLGAVIVGEQSLADALRTLIDKQVDIRPLMPHLRTGDAALKTRVQEYIRAMDAPGS